MLQSHGFEGLAPEGGKGTPRSVASDLTDVQGPAPVDLDLGTEGETRMSSLCQTQMRSRLQDVRFYLSSRIRNIGVSKESRMELLEVLCLVDPDFDYQ